MNWGMENRLSQLMPMANVFLCRLIMVIFKGRPGIWRSRERRSNRCCLMWMRSLSPEGYCGRRWIPLTSKPIVLRVSGCTSMVGEDLANEELTTSIEEIIRVNAAAVGLSIFIGSHYEKETLKNLATLVNACEDYGIPVMAVTAVGRELEKREARYLSLCCRIAAELGARVVKTYWCDEHFDKVVNGCPVPIIMAGGPKCETELEVLEFVHDGIEKGAVGINLGRNVWQSPHPVAMAKALRAIVHDNASVKQAHEILKQTKENKPKRRRT